MTFNLRTSVLAAVLLLFGLVATQGSEHRNVQGDDLSRIENLTGSEFCSANEIHWFEKFEGFRLVKQNLDAKSNENQATVEKNLRKALLKDFANEQNPCVDLGEWALDFRKPRSSSHRKNIGFIQLAGAKLPLILTRPLGSESGDSDFSGTIVVRVSGGPGLIPINPVSDYIVRPADGEILVDLFHSGSGINLIHPSPNFLISVGQIRQFVDILRQKNRNAKIIVYGESLGGLSSITALSSNSSADKLIALNPTSWSPRSLVKYYEEQLVYTPQVEYFQYYRVVRSPDAAWNPSERTKLNRLEVLSAYFEDQQYDLNLIDRLSDYNGPDLLIVYGNEDLVIGVDTIRKIPDSPKVRIESIPTMSHAPTKGHHFVKIRDIIEDFIHY